MFGIVFLEQNIQFDNQIVSIRYDSQLVLHVTKV